MTQTLPTSANVLIAIPTFRRLPLLEKLLDSLIPEIGTAGYGIIIGDNDCDDAVKAFVEAYRNRGLNTHYIPISQRGVSQVRNGLIEAAMTIAPDWQWLLMLDDDGEVTPGWLSTILTCSQTYDADLTGGPVNGQLPADANILARNSIFAERRRWPTGLVPSLNTTQNLVISRRAVTTLGLPLFQANYGASGGEDYDLFRRMARASGRIVWCDEAVVNEPAPADRLTPKAVLFRYYSTGIYMSYIDRSYDGFAQGIVMTLKGLVRATIELGLFTLTRKPDKRARARLTLAHYLGRSAGLAGIKSARYVS